MVTQRQWWPALEAAAKGLRKKALDLRRDFNRKKMKTARVKCRRRMGLPKSGELDALLGKGVVLARRPCATQGSYPSDTLMASGYRRLQTSFSSA